MIFYITAKERVLPKLKHTFPGMVYLFKTILYDNIQEK